MKQQPAQQHQQWAQQQHQAAVKRHQEFAQRQAAQSQAQMQRMQQMQREQFLRMQQAGWWQQQQRMKANRIAQPPMAAGTRADPFGRAEHALQQLHEKAARGELAAESLPLQLDELTVQDEQGSLWALGVDNHAWYRFDPARRTWTPGVPPRLTVSSGRVPATGNLASADTHPIRAALAFLVALAVTIALGFLVGNVTYALLPESWDSLGGMACAVVVWLVAWCVPGAGRRLCMMVEVVPRQ